MDGEAAFGIVNKAELLAGLLNGDDIHETSWVCSIGADFPIDLDEALHDDRLSFTAVQRILEAVSEEDDERKRVAQLVRTRRRTRSISTGELVKKPVRWRAQALLMFLSAIGVSRWVLKFFRRCVVVSF